jgi:hypothetical protein
MGLKVVTARLAEMVKNSAVLDINRTGHSVKALATAGNPELSARSSASNIDPGSLLQFEMDPGAYCISGGVNVGRRSGGNGRADPHLLTAGCASAPLNRAGSLTSYDGLTPSDGVLTKSIVRLDQEDVLGAKTVRLVETRFSTKAAAEVSFSPEQRQRHRPCSASD